MFYSGFLEESRHGITSVPVRLLIFLICPFSLPKPDEKDPEMGTKEPPWVTPGPVS